VPWEFAGAYFDFVMKAGNGDIAVMLHWGEAEWTRSVISTARTHSLDLIGSILAQNSSPEFMNDVA
jgi:hypothetical protein